MVCWFLPLLFSSQVSVWLSATPWTSAHQASLSFTISLSLLRFMSIESVMSSNHLILCRPLLLLPLIFRSIRVFSIESALHIRWPKYWRSASASVLQMNIQDWFPLGLTGLISLQSSELTESPQDYRSNASILWGSAFFMVQLSHPYITIGKIMALTIWTFIGKMMSLLSNMLPRFVIAFLPRSKHLLISWLHLLSAVNLKFFFF